MEVREQQIYTTPVWKKFYYPSLGYFKDIFHEQKFDNEAEATTYQDMIAARQWNVGGVYVIYVDDILATQHPNIRTAAKSNGFYRFEYDYSGDWRLSPCDFESILAEKEESIRDLQSDMLAIRSHPVYSHASVGSNPLYIPPNQEQSNALA